MRPSARRTRPCGTRVSQLEVQLAAARKSSANSSKPPSPDIAKPAPQRPLSKRKRGAQPGRKRHERQPFPPEQIDGVQDHALEFSGVLGCDYFSAYRKYMRLNENVLVQFCLAHLIRDVKFLAEHPQAQNRASGQRLLAQLRELFAIIHRRNEYASEEAFQGAFEDQGYELWTAAISRTPSLARQKRAKPRTWPSDFTNTAPSTFAFSPRRASSPPTTWRNRRYVLWCGGRRVTQGTRSLAGRTWCERIGTAIATCTQHGRSVFHFLHHALLALFGNTPPPSLPPTPLSPPRPQPA